MFAWFLNAFHHVVEYFVDIDAKMREKIDECLVYVKENATRGDPASMVAAIDAFSAKHLMMTVGDKKGPIVEAQIRLKKPRVMVELGGYIGYSALRFASLQRELVGAEAEYYTFEPHEPSAKVIEEMIAFAGLADQVTVITGTFADNFDVVKDKTVDIVFIDHDKTCYLADAKRVVEGGLLRKGSLLVADNVVFPGAPDYLEYVENSAQFTTQRFESYVDGPINFPDAVSVAEYQG